MKQSRVPTNRYLLLVVIIGVAALAPSVYFYAKFRQAARRLANPTETAKEEARVLAGKVGKLMMLPADEEPTVAVISDVSKLADQPFFANAQNGDKVLIYINNKKAILYRPSANKILDVAPVNLSTPSAATLKTPGAAEVAGTTTPTPAKPTSPQAQFTVVLYNGTTVTGLTKKYETELKAKIGTANIVRHGDAKSREYKKTLLIDLTGTRSQDATSFAATLGIAVGSLPKDETKPTGADFLIIVGEDKK